MSASKRSDSAFTIIFTPGTHLRTGTFIKICKKTIMLKLVLVYLAFGFYVGVTV